MMIDDADRDRQFADWAKDLALQVHAGQTDKVGEPYIGHVERVVARMGTHREQAVAWLHDAIEDTHLDFRDLTDLGFPNWLLDALHAITHQDHEPRARYYERIKRDPLALAVKLADIADNTDPRRTLRLDIETAVRLLRKYADALEALEERP